MNYYLDTEFIEDFIDARHWPSLKKYSFHYIDLISIGIVAEDGREYYAVNKEFDLRHVWNKYDIQGEDLMGTPRKVYWLRENVLRPIYDDLLKKRSVYEKTYHAGLSQPFSYKGMKYLIENHGKTKAEIAKEIQDFTRWGEVGRTIGTMEPHLGLPSVAKTHGDPVIRTAPVFYGYYCDYDWVVFCSLFGRMLDLPKGYPMYMRDLKQMSDEIGFDSSSFSLDLHHALADARWNKELHNKLLTLAKTTTDENY